MKTLIIPCAGNKKIDGQPPYLLRHPDGKLLLMKCIETVPLMEDDKVVVVILTEDNRQYHASDIIYGELQREINVNVVMLNESSGGAAETVFKAIQIEKVVGEIVIKDINNFLKTPSFHYRNYIVGLNLMKHKCDIHKLQNKSFLRVNESGQVLDIIEKHILSEYICVGLYGVGSADDFVNAYLRLADSNYHTDKIYISHVIAYLMGYKNRIFHYVEADYLEDWTEESTWMQVQNKYALYFLNLDTLFNGISDIEIIKDRAGKINQLGKNGASFIGFTAKGSREAEKIRYILHENGINCLQIVNRCPLSNIKKVVETQNDIDRYFYAI